VYSVQVSGQVVRLKAQINPVGTVAFAMALSLVAVRVSPVVTRMLSYQLAANTVMIQRVAMARNIPNPWESPFLNGEFFILK